MRFLLGLLLNVLVISCFAENLAAMLDHINSMQADFVQVIQDNKGKAVQRAVGSMALQRPGKFRWQVKKPIPQIIIANDTRLWIYDPDLEQVTVKSLNQQAGETPALLLSHNNNRLESEFQIKQTSDPASNMQWFSLTPLRKDSVFAVIDLGFKNNHITEMKLKDHLGHTTTVQFQHIKVNPALSSALFVFKTRPGVDVIDETRKR